MFMCEYRYTHMCPSATKMAAHPLELDLQAVVNQLMWVLRTKVRSFGRTQALLC